MYGILPVIAGIISIVLAGLVLFGGANDKRSKWPFVWFAFSVGVWAIGVGCFSLTVQQSIAEDIVYAYYIAALFIAYWLMVFCLRYGQKAVSRWVVGLALLPLLAVALLIFPLDTMIIGIDAATHTVTLDHSMYALYTLLFVAYITVSLGILWRRAFQKRRIRRHWLLAASLTICLAGGGFFNLILPGLGNYDHVVLGPLFTFIMVATVFYSIIRHGLFDVRLALVRTVTYLLSLATLAGIYLLVAFLLFGRFFGQTSSPSQLAVNVALALLLAFVFQPIRRFFDRLTSKIFYRDTYSVSDFFAELNRELASTTDLRELLIRASAKIAQTMKVNDASFVVYTSSKRSIQRGSGPFRHISHKDVRWLDEIVPSYPPGPIAANMFYEDEADAMRRFLVSCRMSAIVPLVQRSVLIGYLFLGEHQRHGYSNRDLRVMRTLADELGIAIQNALSVEQIREINGHLEQRIQAATEELRANNTQLQRLDEVKDEFISMASHQLRTPLTSIKGYLSMLIEGDLGELTKEQKHVLSEAFVSSERMVRLIGDFLNVSRLQTGKFVIDKRPVDLAQLVQRELDALQSNAAARNMKFSYKKPKNIPILELDENKIEQVVMNFSDNAIYYAEENGTIVVTVRKVDNFVEFTVKDNGIGVPKEDQKHLFTKFYRASNARKARPDGTGVGLFLAKKVIDDHDGSIIFSSEEGKGSTFGFRLPLPRDTK